MLEYDATDGITKAVCDICDEPIRADEPFTDDGSEIAHKACVGQWFRSQWGRETLHR
jgi:hypothetical protein